MAVSSLHVVHGMNTASGFIGQVVSSSVNTGIEIVTGVPSGHPQPLFKAVRGQAPEITMDTNAVATALGITGLLGANLSGGNVDFYHRAATEYGTRQSGSNHYRYRATANCLLVPTALSADHQGEATISLRAALAYDGSNEPIIPAGSQALAGTPSASEYFGAGPCALNGSSYGGVQSIQVDWGMEVVAVGGETEPWPTFLYVAAIMPRITITVLDLPWTAIGLDGLALSSWVFYLRKKANSGVNVANATAEHISFSGSDGIAYVESSTGGGNDPVETTFVIEPNATADDTDCMTIDTTAAIS